VEQAGFQAEVEVDSELAADARLTLRAKNLQAGTVLDTIAQTAGGHWSLEQRENKTRLRLSKHARATNVLEVNVAANPLTAPRAVGTGHGEYGVFLSERLTFSCPHCKDNATIIREARQPNCAKCNRLFEPRWQFCPADGAKRPATTPEWKYCPLCGKQVDPQKTSFRITPDLPNRLAGGLMPCLSGASEEFEAYLEFDPEFLPSLPLPGSRQVRPLGPAAPDRLIGPVRLDKCFGVGLGAVGTEF